MSRLYGVLPWGLIALGTLHMAATWRFYRELTSASLWFFNGGLVLVFAGVLNLINRRHGAQFLPSGASVSRSTWSRSASPRSPASSTERAGPHSPS
jgi:hypothetical protein